MMQLLRVFLLVFALIPIWGIRAGIAQDVALEDLRNLMNGIFPGNAEITVEGAVTTLTDPVCLDAVPFPVQSKYHQPLGYIQSEDRGPEKHLMFANILVKARNHPEIVIPAEVWVTILEPDSNSENIVPVMENAYSPEINIPRASTEVEMVYSESLSDSESFNRNPNGNVLFKFEVQENGLIEVRLMAFNFSVEDSSRQQVHVRGGVHDVIIPWFLTYTALPDDQSSFVVLSGIAYGIAEPDTIRAESRVINGIIQYTIQLETMAVLKDAADSSPVPMMISFTAIPDENDIPYRGELTNFEITVDGVSMEDYTTALKRPLPMLWFVREGDVLSGDTRLAFSNGCGGYLQMDLLFRDIPLNKPD